MQSVAQAKTPAWPTLVGVQVLVVLVLGVTAWKAHRTARVDHPAVERRLAELNVPAATAALDHALDQAEIEREGNDRPDQAQPRHAQRQAVPPRGVQAKRQPQQDTEGRPQPGRGTFANRGQLIEEAPHGLFDIFEQVAFVVERVCLLGFTLPGLVDSKNIVRSSRRPGDNSVSLRSR